MLSLVEQFCDWLISVIKAHYIFCLWPVRIWMFNPIEALRDVNMLIILTVSTIRTQLAP